MARPKLPLHLSAAQHAELTRLVQTPSTPQKIVRRARIALLAAAGKDNRQIAVELNTSHVTVGQWRQRVLDLGLIGLQEAPRPGRPKTLPAHKVRTVVTEVAQPSKEGAHWSCRSMARHSGLSRSAVQRLWAANDLKPHRTRTFKPSTNPQFETKFWDVMGLYLNPPVLALVLCCDEKGKCQVLERTQPGLPLGQGHIATRTYDYYRHGMGILFAALNYLNGKILAERAARHRHQEWLKFLQAIEKTAPAGVAVHLILDNYATHKHPKVRRWLAQRPHFHLHFTPTRAAWLNLVERFFRNLNQDVLLPGSFASVGELTAAIWDYLAERNFKPQRYEWRAEEKAVLEKIHRVREALATQSPVKKDNLDTHGQIAAALEQRVNVHFSWKLFFHESNRIEAVYVTQHRDHPAHDHEFVEIVVVTGGSCLHQHVLGEQRLGKGDAFLMRPGAWHAYRNCRNLALYDCCFDPGIIGRELSWMIDNPLLGRLLWSIPLSPAQRGMVLMHLPDSELTLCWKVLDALCALSTTDSMCYQGDRVGLLVQLLSALSRQLPGPAPAIKSTKPHPATLAALKLIDNDPTQPWTMKSLAAQVHVNPAYLTRQFDAVARLPPMAYLRRRRLELATALLANSKHPVSNVGNLVGWPDPNYFTRRFRAEFGLSPSAYRSRFLKTRAAANGGKPNPGQSGKAS